MICRKCKCTAEEDQPIACFDYHSQDKTCFSCVGNLTYLDPPEVGDGQPPQNHSVSYEDGEDDGGIELEI